MLTEQEIKQLKVKDKRYRVYDINNLVLEITKTGLKSWRLKTKNSFITLGHYPAISLKEARILAISYTKEKKSEVKTYAFETVVFEWFERQEWSQTHTKDTMQKLKAYVLPVFAKMDISSITRLEILEEVRKIEAQRHYETCKKSIGIFKMILDYAIICGYSENNPALGLQAAIKTAKRIPMAALTKKEEMTAHGFRAMSSTTLNSMGFRPDLIEKSLAHSDKDKVRSAYNRADYLEERREMLSIMPIG